MSARGFGIAAAAPDDFFEALAKSAEDVGYRTFWVNDTPGADGFERLARSAQATTAIRLGVGVVPVDRRSANELLESIEEFALPTDRLIVGIGAGATRKGSLELVSNSIEELREGTNAQVAIGALRPNMVKLSAQVADAVLLNWLTPDHADRSRSWMRSANRETATEVIGYVRVGLPGAEERVAEEASRYAAIPQYGRHFKEMGVQAVETCVAGPVDLVTANLGQFDRVLDETVVRAVAESESLEQYLDILDAAQPRPE